MRAPVITLLLTAGFVLAGCADAINGPEGTGNSGDVADDAGSSTSSVVSHVDRRGSFEWVDVLDNCSEPIYLEGIFSWHTHRVLTPSDVWNYVSNYDAIGEGYGLTSGAPYKFMAHGTFSQHVGPDEAGQIPWIEREETLELTVGAGSAPNIRGKYHFNYTVNAAGDLVIDEESYELSCQ